MIQHYYELPIKFNELIKRNRELATCDLKKSIAQNIYLTITSKFKENRYDETYGCELWDMDFELVSNENAWIEKIRKSVLKSVTKHETRLFNINVEIDITQDEQVLTLKNSKSVKKRLSIFVNGIIAETGEPFPFNTNIYLSPLSLD
ncbi:MAG TPA: GPW/gp25 family protein [Panacibacter sp.]|nr:GPW/gp25 family protein [Panacibacter sp.]